MSSDLLLERPPEQATFSVNAPPKVLVLTHSHPLLTKGGAEISADSLVKGLRRYFDAKAWLLGCSRKPQTDRMAVGFTQPFGEDDFVYQAQDSFDYFKFANRDPKFPEIFTGLLRDLQPDIVHFHHYAHFGVEAFALTKRTLPDAKIVLTLHEFLAICNNHGQMVKTQSGRLCEKSGPIDCSLCFPAVGPRDFFLRKEYISTFFEKVDLFISPSHFLAERYRSWGIPAEKMVVIENVPATQPSPEPSDLVMLWPGRNGMSGENGGTPSRRSIKIGFFGQMSPLKGILVLLNAAHELARDEIDTVTIDIHGDYSNQPPEFQTAVKAGLEEAGTNVRFCGPYDNAHVRKLMGTVDAVIVPSTWWENSPVVIEEALEAGKPVICSNIGGMAEKVRPGIDGLWFEVGDSRSLAQLLRAVANAPDVFARLAKTARAPPTVEQAVLSHLAAYNSLFA